MTGKPTILCVDDQILNLQIRAMMLEQFGCRALTAPDHQSALRAISEEEVDLVVIDYHLANGETGEEVARDVRVMRPQLPLIMLTGDSRLPQSACDCVDEVIIKGASDPRALFDLIQKLLPDAELRPRRTLLVSGPPAASDHDSEKAS